MIKFDTSHYGEYKSNAEKFGYKTILITGPIQGKKNVHFGRLIQVRKKSGAFGSDTVLLRESDGSLQAYHNMGFFSVNEEYLELYEAAMKEVDEKDLDQEGREYSIMEKNPAIGFIVEGLDDINGETYFLAITTTKK